MSSGVFIVGQAEREAIKNVLARARSKPVPRNLVEQGKLDPGRVLKLADRPAGWERPASDHVMLGSYRVAVSFEDQPIGLCIHLSASSARPGFVPGQQVMDAILSEFGIEKTMIGMSWLEEFDPGHHAINVVALVEAATHLDSQARH
jgi:hypothetical protein